MQRGPCESSMAASTTAWHCSEGPVGPQQLALDFMAFKSKKSLLSSQGAWSYKYSGNDLPCFWICFGRVLCAITGWNPAGGRSGSGCRYVSGWPGPDPEFVRSPRPSCSRWMAPTPAWRPAGHLRHKWHDARRIWTFNVKENSFQICHPKGLGKNLTVGRFSIIVCVSLLGGCVISVFSFWHSRAIFWTTVFIHNPTSSTLFVHSSTIAFWEISPWMKIWKIWGLRSRG